MNNNDRTQEKFVDELFTRLKNHFGEPVTPLFHKNPEQLTVAVVLSAQTTDDNVNKVTPGLFEAYPDLESLAKAEISDVEKLIFSTGFYKNKAKHIVRLAQMVVEKHHGKIPANFDSLLELPGVGRKTANVVMDCAFHTSVGVVVDTHVKRLSNRFALTGNSDPIKIEKDLMKVLPQKYWKDITLYMIYLGRKYCVARKPNCPDCFLNDICPSAIMG
ncbi:MAG: endonuclease III [Leptospirales bacterium]